jgi:hypothetical protein
MNSPDSTIIGVYSYSDSVDYPSSDSWNRCAIAKIDLEGNLLWEERYAPSLYSGTWLSSAAITNDGKVIASGYKNNYPSYPLDVSFLICFSNNGDSLWYHTYSLLNANYSINTLFGVIPTSDGGFAAVGRVIPYPPDTGKQDVWVLKVDSLGNELPVTIGEQSGDRAENAEIEIYPNPASNSVTIILPIKDKAELVRLGIYNIYGNKVKEIQMPKDETRVTLNIGNWKNGMYIVTAIEGNRIIEKRKFIKY